MRYLHTMLRVRNLDTALKFYQDALGLKEVRRVDNDKAKADRLATMVGEEFVCMRSKTAPEAVPFDDGLDNRQSKAAST